MVVTLFQFFEERGLLGRALRYKFVIFISELSFLFLFLSFLLVLLHLLQQFLLPLFHQFFLHLLLLLLLLQFQLLLLPTLLLQKPTPLLSLLLLLPDELFVFLQLLLFYLELPEPGVRLLASLYLLHALINIQQFSLDLRGLVSQHGQLLLFQLLLALPQANLRKLYLQSFLQNIVNNVLPSVRNHRQQIRLKVRRLCIEIFLEMLPHGPEIFIFIADYHMIRPLLSVTHQLQDFLDYQESTSATWLLYF